MFADRLDAARRLAPRLEHLRAERPVVVGIPRGAVPMARLLAEALGAELDVVWVHKVGHPWSPEFAVAAVDEQGVRVDGDAPGAGELDLGALVEHQRERLRERRERVLGGRPPVDVAGRTVVVVDDGLATGLTMLAALRSLRARGAGRLVAVAPVAAASALEKVKAEADETLVLDVPPRFDAVGSFYGSFAQVTDEEVAACLAKPDGPEAPLDPVPSACDSNAGGP